MAAVGEVGRIKRLSALGLQYPIWVFDVDQFAWPRKLVSILPGSRPAKVVGWYAWPWEYGTSVKRFDDELSDGIIRPDFSKMKFGSFETTLSILRYDDSAAPDTYRIVYETHPYGTAHRDLSEWIFEKDDSQYVAVQRVFRIERKWDDTPVWDREAHFDLVNNWNQNHNAAYGVASLVNNDWELRAATGILIGNVGGGIRKMQFEFVDAEGGLCKGIVFPERHQVERGIYLIRGPDFAWNREILAGTAL